MVNPSVGRETWKIHLKIAHWWCSTTETSLRREQEGKDTNVMCIIAKWTMFSCTPDHFSSWLMFVCTISILSSVFVVRAFFTMMTHGAFSKRTNCFSRTKHLTTANFQVFLHMKGRCFSRMKCNNCHLQPFVSFINCCQVQFIFQTPQDFTFEDLLFKI